jgi:UDP-N-acetylmuramate dehydrogenase
MHIQANVSLKQYNTFGIDVIAKSFATFSNIETLKHLTSTINSNILIIGGGSNILFTKNYEGLVLKNEIIGIEVVREDDNWVYVRSGAGVNWHTFVLFCINNNFIGVENLSLIPGSVGASPMQNIGAYGVEVKDVFFELEAYHIKDKKLITFDNKACEFGYRESIFKNKYKDEFIITTVTFRLSKKVNYNVSYGAIETELQRMNVQSLSIKSISDAIINIRSSKLPNPKLIGNAGSFFKNPTIVSEKFEDLKKIFPEMIGYKVSETETKLAAGWLIEQCGWKGFRQGDVGCYEKQALVLVNYGDAKGEDVLLLSDKIIESVKLKFDVLLSREVNVF